MNSISKEDGWKIVNLKGLNQKQRLKKIMEAVQQSEEEIPSINGEKSDKPTSRKVSSPPQ
jgi:RAB protein geranylgeranyltransferase component A